MNRRSLLALGGLGAFGAASGAAGPELDITTGAIIVKIAKPWGHSAGWRVLVPDLDRMGHIGQLPVPVNWMPLQDFLDQIDKLNMESNRWA